jgi:hypothetical protein
MSEKAFKKEKGKEHLAKDFLEELKHKIWSTKGTRFTADTRLRTIANYSTLGISFLASYLIIFGSVAVYNLFFTNTINPDIIAFTITALTIVVLIFSLLKNAKNVGVKAKNLHDFGLGHADIDNELQNYKPYKNDSSENEKMEFGGKLQIE